MSISEPQYFNTSHIKHHNNNNLSKQKSINISNSDKLDEIFKAATDTIQNLPKNGNFIFKKFLKWTFNAY
jgi:hypothetical protein